MSSDKNYIPISTVTGAVIGAGYGFRNPSEKVCKKIAQVKPSIIDTMKNYSECFDIKNAGAKVRSGELRLDEYKKTADIYGAIYNVYQKEQQVKDIMDMPIDQRPMTFKQAVKEANKSHIKLFKAMIKFNNSFKEKLTDLEIFDAEKFTKTYHQAAKKTALMYKELSKGALKGLGIGAMLGSFAGIALNNISKK